jgi:hypothetical protein
MTLLFSIIISKRLFFDAQGNIQKLMFHVLIIGLVMLSLRVHRTSEIATRLIPLMIGCLSYYGHTRYLLFNKNRAAITETEAHII